MVPAASLLLSGNLHFSEHSGDGAIGEALAMHFEYGADDLLLALMIYHLVAYASFAEWQAMYPIGRFAGLSEGDSEPDQSAPDCSFGGREFGGNLPHRALFQGIFLMEDGFIKSYWKCINH